MFRTYSDTDHLIRNTRSGAVYSEAIDATDSEEYEEMDEYIDPDVGSYEDVVAMQDALEQVTTQINRLHLTDNQALSVSSIYPKWSDKVGKTIEVGYITQYEGRLWRARQTHTALEVYPPSIHTALLYEVINKEHSGELGDPIPYTVPMEVFAGLCSAVSAAFVDIYLKIYVVFFLE